MPRARSDVLIDAFKDVLKAERVRVGLTQEALAFACDIDRTFVGLLENGKRQPSLSVLYAIARGLGVTPQFLLEQVDHRLRHVSVKAAR